MVLSIIIILHFKSRLIDFYILIVDGLNQYIESEVCKRPKLYVERKLVSRRVNSND